MPSKHLSGYTQHEIQAFRCCIYFLTPTTSGSPHCLRPRPRCVDPHVRIPTDVLILNSVEGRCIRSTCGHGRQLVAQKIYGAWGWRRSANHKRIFVWPHTKRKSSFATSLAIYEKIAIGLQFFNRNRSGIVINTGRRSVESQRRSVPLANM